MGVRYASASSRRCLETAGQWQLAVPVKANTNWQGRLEIDGQEPAGRAGADVSGTTFGNWTVAWLNMSQGLRLNKSTS
jgi:hypothetical protein